MNPFFASSTPTSSGSTRTTRRIGNQRQRPGGRSNFADRLGTHEENPPVEALRHITRLGQQGRKLPNHTRRALSANDVPFLIISFRLENSRRFVCRGSRHGRVKVWTGTPFLGASTPEKQTDLATILAMSAPFRLPAPPRASGMIW